MDQRLPSEMTPLFTSPNQTNQAGNEQGLTHELNPQLHPSSQQLMPIQNRMMGPSTDQIEQSNLELIASLQSMQPQQFGTSSARAPSRGDQFIQFGTFEDFSAVYNSHFGGSQSSNDQPLNNLPMLPNQVPEYYSLPAPSMLQGDQQIGASQPNYVPFGSSHVGDPSADHVIGMQRTYSTTYEAQNYVMPVENPLQLRSIRPQGIPYPMNAPPPYPMNTPTHYLMNAPNPSPMNPQTQYLMNAPNPSPMNGATQYLMNAPNPSPMRAPTQYLLNAPHPSSMNTTTPYLMNAPNPSPMNAPNPGIQYPILNAPNPYPMNAPNPNPMNSPNPNPMNTPTGFEIGGSSSGSVSGHPTWELKRKRQWDDERATNHRNIGGNIQRFSTRNMDSHSERPYDVYDKRHQEVGIPVDPHLRLFLARIEGGNGDPSTT